MLLGFPPHPREFMDVSCEAGGYYGPKYLAKLLSKIDEGAVLVPVPVPVLVLRCAELRGDATSAAALRKPALCECWFVLRIAIACIAVPHVRLTSEWRGRHKHTCTGSCSGS